MEIALAQPFENLNLSKGILLTQGGNDAVFRQVQHDGNWIVPHTARLRPADTIEPIAGTR